MTKNRKGYKQKKKKQQKKQDELEDIVKDTAGVFTCYDEVARDFLWQCDQALDTLETDIIFNRLANDIWKKQVGPNGMKMAEALGIFLKERLQFQESILKIKDTLSSMADEQLHEHLEPLEEYQELVRNRLSLKLSEQE